jgi:hypothetical protein
MTLTEGQVVGLIPPRNGSQKPQPKNGSQKLQQLSAVPDSCEVEGSGDHPAAADAGHIQGGPTPAGNGQNLAATAGEVAEVSGGGRPGRRAGRRQEEGMAQAAVAREGWQWTEQREEVSEGQDMSEDACTIVDDKVASMAHPWPPSHPNPPIASPAR